MRPTVTSDCQRGREPTCTPLRVTCKRCHWFFRRNFYKYWQIFIICPAQLHKRMSKVIGLRISCHIYYVATIPCKSLRHKSNTFHTILALCTCLHRSHLREPVLMKQTKHSRKSEVQNLCSKMSTTHANTCIQSPLAQQTFFSFTSRIL